MVSGNTGGERVIAQYLATKVTWWAAYPRVIVVTASTLSTYNPETFQCTNQWELSEIEDIEAGTNPDQFIVRLEKTRFRSARLRFQCAACRHLLALLARLRRQYRFQPLRFQFGAAFARGSAPQLYYRCIEQFANASYKLFLLQATVCGVLLLDDCGRRVQTLPFIYLERACATPNHPEGVVLATAFQERLFLCIERDACLEEIVAAADAVGVKLRRSSGNTTAAMSIPALRKRNNEILNQPSLVRFEAKKAVNFATDGGSTTNTTFKTIQLILQGDALVEVHRSMRTVISWPYAALLAIVRPDWDPKRVTFEFAREETLAVRMDARDQLIALLLLGCREAGLPLVPVCSGEFDRSRFFHPHPGDSYETRGNGLVLPTMNMSIETFLLRHLIQTDVRFELVATANNNNAIRRALSDGVDSTARTRRSTGDAPERTSSLEDDETSGEGAGRVAGGWFQRRVRDRKWLLDKGDVVARHSMDSTGVSMNDNVCIRVAMEELNTNLHFGDLTSVHCNHKTLLKAIEVVIEHLVALVNAMRKHADISSAQVVVTLQALTRLTSLPGAFFSNGMIHRVLDAIQELLIQQDSLTCYWCLKLLQAFFDAEKTARVAVTVAMNTIPANAAAATKVPVNMPNDQRAKAVQYFVQQKEIQHTIVDLLPSSFGDSAVHSGYWMHDEEGDAHQTNDNSSSNGEGDTGETYELSSLQTSEARVGANMNIVHFDALFTLHQVVMHLARAERQQRTSAGQRRHLQHRRHHRQANDGAGEAGDVPAARQSAVLAEKLLRKFRFITDSVVDMRLTRTAETSVALAKFLVAHFSGGVPHMRRRNSVVAVAAVGDHGPRAARGDRHGRREKRRNSIAAIASNVSNQDTHEFEGDESDDGLSGRAAALCHLKAFLADYERKKHPFEYRSRPFRPQHTILAPLSTLSQQTTSDNMTEVLMSYRRECERQLRDVCNSSRRQGNDTMDDPLTLEHLIEDESGNSHHTDNRRRRNNRHRRQSMYESSLRISFSEIDRRELCGSRDRSSLEKSSNGSLHCSRVDSAYAVTRSDISKRRRHSVASTPSIVKISDLAPPSTSRPVRSDNQREEQPAGEMFPTESMVGHQGSADPTPLTASRRAVAHACDACIGCNDVYANNKCFFCVEKEYQLRLAFGGSAVVRGDQQQMRRPSERAPPVSMSTEQRQYSSCELRRHQTPRSCWVLVDGDVYDVTDLLGAHPGGAQVLLEAAQKGKDCAAVIANHPPAARQVLANYRLGKFYYCEKRTVPQ